MVNTSKVCISGTRKNPLKGFFKRFFQSMWYIPNRKLFNQKNSQNQIPPYLAGARGPPPRRYTSRLRRGAPRGSSAAELRGGAPWRSSAPEVRRRSREVRRTSREVRRTSREVFKLTLRIRHTFMKGTVSNHHSRTL